MIEFVTLLLGLMTGSHAVEVAVGPEIQAVQWRLDGEVVATKSEPPWRVHVQFGEHLRPRRLAVVGFGRDGRPLARAEQLVNYIRETHEVAVVLEGGSPEGGSPEGGSPKGGSPEGGSPKGGSPGGPTGGRIVSKGVLGHRAVDYRLKFDGRELRVETDGSFELPAYDRERPHALEAEVTFSDGVKANTETTFGGGLGEEVTSSLSAFAVTGRQGRPWTVEEADGWLRRDGLELPIFRTQSEDGLVVIVRDEALTTQRVWSVRGLLGAGRNTERQKTFRLAAVDPMPILKPTPTFRIHALGVGRSAAGLMQAVAASPDTYGFLEPRDGPQDLWAALATGGREAAASRAPRVVILMLSNGAGSSDGLVARDSASGRPVHPELALQEVLDYLESIHVPVLVWAPTRKPLKQLGLQGSKNAWAGPDALTTLCLRATTWLESQTMIWVEGEHLPTEVELVSDRKKVFFAGVSRK